MFDQKIPYCLIKITFLVKVETTVSSSIKSRFGNMALSTRDTALGLWFFFFP